LCGPLYLRYSLSLRDVEELLEERGLNLDHTTVWRWVQCYGLSWSSDCVGISSQPTSLGDRRNLRSRQGSLVLLISASIPGCTIDFLLSAFRDADAANDCFARHS